MAFSFQKQICRAAAVATLGAFVFMRSAYSQPPPSTPIEMSDVDDTGGDFNMLSVSPKSLPSQRLHSASYPGEAEVRCGFAEPCAFGLARGFVVGSHLLRLVGTPIFSPLQVPGKWLFYDAFLGFQFLRQVGDPYYANGSLGYRQFSFEDSDGRLVSTSGVTFRVAFAQEIFPGYTQALHFDGYMGDVKYNRHELIYRNTGSDLDDVRNTLRKFYRLSRQFPRVRLGMPADLELINWKASHIDLPSDIRGYLRVEPFYVQNDLSLSRGYSWTEKNFGLRLAPTFSYESSPVDRAGRYTFLAAFGPEVSTSKFSFSAGDRSEAYEFHLLPRPTLDYFAEIMASYQF